MPTASQAVLFSIRTAGAEGNRYSHSNLDKALKWKHEQDFLVTSLISWLPGWRCTCMQPCPTFRICPPSGYRRKMSLRKSTSGGVVWPNRPKRQNTFNMIVIKSLIAFTNDEYHLVLRDSQSVGQSVQSLFCVRFFATPWIAARQASLSITISWSSLRLNVHRVRDAIQPSHPLSSPFPPAPNPS